MAGVTRRLRIYRPLEPALLKLFHPRTGLAEFLRARRQISDNFLRNCFVCGKLSLFGIIRVTSWRPGQLPGWPAPYPVPGIVCEICEHYQQFKSLFKVGYSITLQAVEEV